MIAEFTNDFSNIGVADVYVDRRDDHGDDRQPRQRRHRLEDLNKGIHPRADGAAQAAENACGHRDRAGQQEARKDRLETGDDLVDIGRLARVFDRDAHGVRIVGNLFCESPSLPLVECLRLHAFRLVVGPQDACLVPDRRRSGNFSEARLDRRRDAAPGEQKAARCRRAAPRAGARVPRAARAESRLERVLSAARRIPIRQETGRQAGGRAGASWRPRCRAI